MDVSAEERQEILEGLWEEGGFKFLWGSFSDLTLDPAANEIASEFIRSKIREIVKDPETAERLCPNDHPYGSKRPPIDTDYYVTFNRENVRLVDIRAIPIEAITPTGLRTRSGVRARRPRLRHGLRRDDGLAAQDRHPGQPAACAWPTPGPTARAPCSDCRSRASRTCSRSRAPGSPSVLVNMPVAIEHHVDWIADCIRAHARARQDAHRGRRRPPRTPGSSTWPRSRRRRSSGGRTPGTSAPTSPASRGS